MRSETETLAKILAAGRFDPSRRARLTALLAGADLSPWFAAVDDSPYSLEDWLRALAVFDEWLESRDVTVRPAASMLGYLECCTLTLAETLPLPEFPALLIENLDRYGFDAAREARSGNAEA